MTVPYKVKAIYEYRSEEPDDLSFDNGQIITVTEEDDVDWYTGEYVNAAGQKLEGIFPRNFVEKYEPAIPTRPTRTQRKVPQPGPVAEDAPSSAVTAATTETAPPAVSAPPPAHEVSNEAEVDRPKELGGPTAAGLPQPETQPTAGAPAVEETKPAPVKKQPPPVVEKPASSSFKDRIAAFNKPAAAPIAPFKPGGSGAGTGFIKKPFVAPPPSRNAYVPPPRDPPPPKVYRREEDVEHARDEPEREVRPAVVSDQAPVDEDPPKPTSLKDRIALLQQQQLENAQRQAESARKKEKPKKPSKPRTESAEALVEPEDDGGHLERVPTEKSRKASELPGEEAPVRRSTDESGAAPTPPLPSRELVSDTNDADDSGAADTEDNHDVSTEEERSKPRSVKSPPIVAKHEAAAPADAEEEEEDTEEEEDPEIRRRRELRERMAKMSGGMGMMGMFGAGAAPPAPKKPKPHKDEKAADPAREEEEVQRAPPVPIMALPGMSNAQTMPRPSRELEPEDGEAAAQPTSTTERWVDHAEDDYVAQSLSRKSTEKSLPFSPQDRAPPPPPPDDERPQPPQSPGARRVPPPPPPTRRETDLVEDEQPNEAREPASPPPVPSTASTRAVPPPLPTQSRPKESSEAPRAPPPVPMSPSSPQARAPPPLPPTQAPPRRTADSSVHAPGRDESEEEVTEYDGDYDTDIASSAKHKAALKSHNRDSSVDEGALSDDGAQEAVSAHPRTVPPPVPTAVPRDAPPPPPPPPTQSTPHPRMSIESPRAAPPPVPPPQAMPPFRESAESPRAAPPPIPLPKTVADDAEYDPYRYSMPPGGLPGMAAATRRKTKEFDNDYMDPTASSQPPPDRGAPPPPTERPAPPAPAAPPGAASSHPEPDTLSMSGALSAPHHAADLGRSNTTSRRSADAPRASIESGFIASDVDLAHGSMWWTQENNPPPSLQNRSDILYEFESATSQKRGGRASVSRDVYVLYQDYSQTTINATYDVSEPSHVSLEQTHERPPMPPRKDQLENASESFGMEIAQIGRAHV